MQIVRGDEIEYTPASHEDPADPGVFKRVLATKFDLLVGLVQMVNWARLPAGKSFRKHFHGDMQEVFIIVDGDVSCWVDGETCDLKRGDAILIDPQEVQQMTNTGSQDAFYVVFGISSKDGGKTVLCDA